MTNTRDKILVLERISCIYYPVQFKKNTNGTQVQALIDYRTEVNVMAMAYASKLGLKVYPTNVGAQKIDGSTLKIFEIVLASF